MTEWQHLITALFFDSSMLVDHIRYLVLEEDASYDHKECRDSHNLVERYQATCRHLILTWHKDVDPHDTTYDLRRQEQKVNKRQCQHDVVQSFVVPRKVNVYLLRYLFHGNSNVGLGALEVCLHFLKTA